MNRSLTAAESTHQLPSWLRTWKGALLLTAFTAVCAQLSFQLPMTPVPATMQVLAVLLSGLLLGRRWGMISQAQYLLLGAMGAPIFALGHGGPAALFGPTGGYLWSYPLAAWIIGYIAPEGAKETISRQAAACGAGMTIIYLSGCLWLGLEMRPMLSLSQIFMMGAGWFLAWDAMKAAIALSFLTFWRKV